MKAIIKKEIADHFSSGRFLLICALIFMVALSSAYLAGGNIRQWLADGLSQFLAGRAFLALYSAPDSFLPIFVLIGYFGPLISLFLGFDAINRERSSGTLAKVLAQPVYRDQVLLGKFLAGLITLAIMTAALLLLIAGLGLAAIGLSPSSAEVARLAVFGVIGVVYLGLWLALAMLMSIICRSVAASALASGAVWVFFAFFVSVAAGGLAESITPVSDPLRPSQPELAAKEHLSRRLSLISPVTVYSEAAGFMLNPARRTLNLRRQALDKATNDRYTGRFYGPIDFKQSFILVVPHLAVLISWSLIILALAHLIFRRQEIHG